MASFFWAVKLILGWVGVTGSLFPFLDLSLNSTFINLGRGCGPHQANPHSSNQEILNYLSKAECDSLTETVSLGMFQSCWIYSRCAMIDADLYSLSADTEPFNDTGPLITDFSKAGSQKTFTFTRSCKSGVMERALGRQLEDVGS